MADGTGAALGLTLGFGRTKEGEPDVERGTEPGEDTLVSATVGSTEGAGNGSLVTTGGGSATAEEDNDTLGGRSTSTRDPNLISPMRSPRSTRSPTCG